MKERKPLKPGDQVKFIGHCSHGELSEGFNIVKCAYGNFVSLEGRGEIERRQVTKVRRKVKKPMREFYIVECILANHSNFFSCGKPDKFCERCEVIKVREVK